MNPRSTCLTTLASAAMLRERAEWLGETLGGLGDAVIGSDAEGRVLALNEVAAQLSGWTVAEAAGQMLHEVFAIRCAAGLAWLRSRDGSERPIEHSTTPFCDEAGGALGAILIVRDASERQRNEEVRAQLASLLESSEDAIASKRLDGIILSWSPGAERLFGYSASDSVGQSTELVIPPEREAEERAILERLRRGERIEQIETVRIAKGGRRVDVSLTVSPLRDRQGQIIGAMKIARDITERKRAEAALRESERRHRFLIELAAATQPLSDPGEIMAAAARLLAEHLDVDRCAYAQVEDESIFVITGDHSRGVPSIVGRWPVAAFGQPCVHDMLANEPYIASDVDHDARLEVADLAAYRATNIQAVICMPLHKRGRFTAAMAVHQSRPRVWTPGEVQLVRSVVGQCWESLERAGVACTLRESEARYRAIVDATPECVKLVAPDGTLLQINPAGLAMVEADSAAEVLGKSIYDFVVPEYRTLFRAFHEQVCRGHGGTLRFEGISLRGSRRHVETAAVPLPAPQGGFMQLGITRDVTERVATELSLRESEESHRLAAVEAAQAAEANAKFRAFFDQGTNFAGLLAIDGRVVEANRLCLDACGFTRDDVIGRPFWECGWWNRSPELMAMVRTGCRQAVTGSLFRTETNFFVASGEMRMIDLILAPVTDPTGRVLFVAATGIDITDRRHMEDSLRVADRLKDEFIALLAHELRNPLAPIRNGLQVLALVRDDAEASERARAMMERQLGHMVRLIDDLLDVSRINRKKMELRCARVQLADVVNSAIETARPLIDGEAHELIVSLPAKPLYLHADLTRLAQVFSNLLTNSAKYTERGGRIRLSAEQRGNEVAVSVQDNGIGIPTDSLATIFDMFAQLNRPLERSSGGLGIGLALVKGLVEMHGGSVIAESRGQGQGSTFTVCLPLLTTAADTSVARTPISEPAAEGPQRRILVVDDNRDGADSLAMVLRLLNNEVRVANDGLEAVTAAEVFRPHVILMDLGMPRLNGYDATRRIREQPWGQKISIIALTGWGQEADRVRSQQAGCDAHLVKPVNLPDLEKLLAKVSPL